MPHQFLLCLVPSQVLVCIGMIMFKYSTEVTWMQYAQFVVSIFGDFTSRCFTVVLSCVIYLLHRKSLDFVVRVRKWLIISAVGFPVICIGFLMALNWDCIDYKHENAFHYGATKADALSVVVLAFCSVLNITFLVLHQRILRRSSHVKQANDVLDAISFTTANEDVKFKTMAHSGSRTNLILTDSLRTHDSRTYSNTNNSINYGSNNDDYTVYWDADDKADAIDVMADKSEYDKSTLQSSRKSRSPACRGVKNIQSAGNDIQNVSEICEGGSSKNDKMKGRVNQTPYGKFLVLLIFSQIAMFVSLFLCTWRLFNDSKSGIYIETEFLGIFLNYGQNFVLFALFGFDVQVIIQRFIKRWRKLVYNVENVHIGPADLTEEEKHLCDQFVKYHLDRCTKDIVSNRK
ncbi:uncharacterized protein LOC132743704 [Ruditapes philippinarum]|uniref:uncharacterized protein LOC132743704 n=1 Tax=Ruditapes philippinarum TaxID=129788 RepID=UPI00295B0248|nr:uncharacterized protein LOC132743704 [Ruditapes philippinarum]